MSFKSYKRGLGRIEDQAIENSRTIFGKFPACKTKGQYNPWWNSPSSRMGRVPRKQR
jgi:hypothetical protein